MLNNTLAQQLCLSKRSIVRFNISVVGKLRTRDRISTAGSRATRQQISRAAFRVIYDDILQYDRAKKGALTAPK